MGFAIMIFAILGVSAYVISGFVVKRKEKNNKIY